MRIGLYFGSFDPPHLAHLILPAYAIHKFNLDKIIYIPSHNSVNKEKHYANSIDRLNMLSLMIKNHPLLFIDKYEIAQNRPVYTYETLLYLKDKYNLKKEDTFLCIGSDWLENLKNWKNFDIITGIVNFIIFQREPDIIKIKEKIFKTGIDSNSFFVLEKYVDISSNEIRNLIFANEEFSYLLSESVYKYIIEKGLYL